MDTSKLENRYRDNLKEFERKAYDFQDTGFKVPFVKQKYEQSCHVFAIFNQCARMRGESSCECCKFYQKHMETLQKLQDPKEVQRRYETWVAAKYGNKISFDSRIKYTDKKGHVGEVERY